jgi:hypothetical protein
LSLTSAVQKTLSCLIHDSRRSENAPPVPVQPLKPHALRSDGLLKAPILTSGASSMLLADSTGTHLDPPMIPLLTAPLTSASDSQSSTPQTPDATQGSHMLSPMLRAQVQRLSLKRVREELDQSRPIKKQRQTRTCQKCVHVDTCPGRRRVTDCPNPCKDCGGIQCKGRNPKRPKRACWNAWE